MIKQVLTSGVACAEALRAGGVLREHQQAALGAGDRAALERQPLVQPGSKGRLHAPVHSVPVRDRRFFTFGPDA